MLTNLFLRTLVFLLLCMSHNLCGSDITNIQIEISEKKVLENFFKAAIFDAGAGYVLFGNKPVCYLSFPADYPNSYVEFERDDINTILHKGVIAWNASSLAQKNGNFRIHTLEKIDNSQKVIEILFINCKAFINTVDQNLSLFQYILGYDLTSKKLLEQILYSGDSFYEILHSNDTLVGILLGFGTDAALYGSRHEEILASPYKSPSLPFKTGCSKEITATANKTLLEITYSPHELHSHFSKCRITPSFGFASLNEELQVLEQRIETSSPLLAEGNPRLIFGTIKGNQSQEALITSFEAQQKTIAEVLASPNFFDSILEKFEANSSELSSQIEKIEIPLEKASQVIAESMWHQWKRLEYGHFEAFIAGVRAENFSYNSENSDDTYSDLVQQKNIRNIVSVLKRTEYFLNNLKSRQDIVWTVPDKVCYRILETGEGDQVKSSAAYLTLTYAIGLGDDTLESNSKVLALPATIKLEETIPGFSLSIVGMKLGETREIFIHPDFAYGLYTTLEKGRYLKAKVHLVEILENTEVAESPSYYNTRESLNIIDKHWSDEKIASIMQEFAYLEGDYLFKNYNNKLKGLSPNMIVNVLRFLQDGNSLSTPILERQKIFNLLIN